MSTMENVCFSPDGLTLASDGWDQPINLWNVKTGIIKSQLGEHYEGFSSLCFSPDGKTLASGKDKSICLWDWKGGKLQLKLQGHQSDVASVCFSPDGLILASGSSDRFINLWNMKAGKQISQLKGHFDEVNSICFSPDGTMLASGDDDFSIRLWDINQKVLIEQERDIDIPDYLDDTNFLKDLQSDNQLKSIIYHHVRTVTANVPTTLIPQCFFQATGALILNGEFHTHLGEDLQPFFELKECTILKNC